MRTALLFLIFNRPNTTKIVFEKIRDAQPQKLYIAADGPRSGNHLDEMLCEQTRSLVSHIDWPCEVKYLFQEKNLGCKKAVSSAIDWFFDNEDEGIIIEDDIVPANEFFGFCESMLSQYRNNSRVMMISGFNPIGANVISAEYFFSENPSIWGWATWKDRWKLYDLEMGDWSEKNYHKKNKGKYPIYVLEQYLEAFEKTKLGLINTWDYQWTYAIQRNSGLAIKPFANLISNIGIIGTHANTQDENHFVPYGSLNLNQVKASDKVTINTLQDSLLYQRAYKKEAWGLRIKYILRLLGALPLAKKILRK